MGHPVEFKFKFKMKQILCLIILGVVCSQAEPFYPQKLTDSQCASAKSGSDSWFFLYKNILTEAVQLRARNSDVRLTLVMSLVQALFGYYKGTETLKSYFSNLTYFFVIFGTLTAFFLSFGVFILPYTCVSWCCSSCKKDTTRSDYRK